MSNTNRSSVVFMRVLIVMAVVGLAAYYLELENLSGMEDNQATLALSFRLRGDNRNKPMLRREFCVASALSTRKGSNNTTTNNMDLGGFYSLVGSTHRLDQAVPTDEPISFLFHRSSARIAVKTEFETRDTQLH